MANVAEMPRPGRAIEQEPRYTSRVSRRANPDRCGTCRLHAADCICALVPTLHTRTRLALFVHYREARKVTNTGQLAARCLARSTVTIIGDLARPRAPFTVDAGEQPVLLAPEDDAVPIATFAGGAPVVLIVPDGTWRQATKMRRRIAELNDVPCVSLPDTGPTAYRLRAEHRPGGLATFEAIARALRILEGENGPAVEAAMLAVFDAMVERTLRSRGIHDRA